VVLSNSPPRYRISLVFDLKSLAFLTTSVIRDPGPTLPDFGFQHPSQSELPIMDEFGKISGYQEGGAFNSIVCVVSL